YIDALCARLPNRSPGIVPPADLLFPGAPVVNLGDRDRQAIARPGFHQGPGKPLGSRRQHPQSLDVTKRDMCVAAAGGRWITRGPLVEQSVAGQVVVDADHVGRARIVVDDAQTITESELAKPWPQRVSGADQAAEQIPRHPAPLVVESSLPV